MNLLNVLYQIIFYPLEMLFELIYSLEIRVIPIPGAAIILLSLIINVILLPIYDIVDKVQKKQRLKENELSFWTEHIKKTFKGDERFLILRTYYRQNGYHPVYVLAGALPLLLEIPFFIAAYRFLSKLSQLKGIPFLIIKDLSKPDALLTLGGVSLNILPVIMTVVNLISGAIYAGEFSGKEKLRMYGLTLIFLFLLYNSPSGLVLYWTCNNIFSLVRNIISLKKKNDILDDGSHNNEKLLPFFLLCELFNILLLGILIPSSLIKASPLEFVDAVAPQNPLHFLVGSISIAIGFFGLWIPFFYFLADRSREKIYKYMCIFSFISIVDYFFFATDLGIISPYLKYNDYLEFQVKDIVFNMLIVVIVSIICLGLYRYKKEVLKLIHVACVIAFIIMSAMNITSISNEYNNADLSQTVGDEVNIPLSSSGKNVVFLMVDRAIGAYVPYIMNEKPELKEKFSGFTYYPNTLSYGFNTMEGSAEAYGGYEYIYDGGEYLSVEKRNQALKLMPELFSSNGYNVTIFDPPFANGQEIPDLSIYNGMPVRAFHATGRFHYAFGEGDNSDRRFRNFFCYSLCKSLPLAFWYTLYDDGYYNDVTIYVTSSVYSYMLENDSMSKGNSFNYTFDKEYAELCNLPAITKIIPGKENTFFMGYNKTTHEPTILKEPEYEPALYVDNTKYDNDNKGRSVVDGRVMHLDDRRQMSCYHVNMAAFIKLGEWFDYLRENGVYDNTRIVIVSDHGCSLGQFDDMILEDGLDMEGANALLMVKDFNAAGYSVDESLMTNADVPIIEMKDLIDNPINPFTGKEVNDDSPKSNLEIKGFNTYRVSGDIFDSDSYSIIYEQ